MKTKICIGYLFLVPSVIIINQIDSKRVIADNIVNLASETSTTATLQVVNQSQTASTQSNDFGIDIASAVLGGFLGWGLTTGVSFLLDRRKLITYLVIAINNHVEQLNANQEWLKKVKDKTVKEGYIIKLAALYTKDDLSKFSSVRDQCLKLLTKDELVKLENLFLTLNQAEVLLDGFCETLQAYKENETVLASDDVESLERRIERILKCINLLPNPETTKKISDLRDNYAGIVEASTLVTDNSAVLPPTNPNQ